MLTWLIREGSFGDVRLDGGLAVVLIIRFEGNALEKNREFGFLIDDRADPAQREALETIVTGGAGGIFKAWRDLTIRLDGVEFVPMKVSHDDEEWRVEVPGLVEGLGGPFRQFMVPENDTCRIYNAPRPEVTPGFLTVGQAVRNIVTGAVRPELGLVEAIVQAHCIRSPRSRRLLLAKAPVIGEERDPSDPLGAACPGRFHSPPA